MFTFDVFSGILGTSIFGNSSSAADITQSRLPTTLPIFMFLMIMFITKYSIRATQAKKEQLLID